MPAAPSVTMLNAMSLSYTAHAYSAAIALAMVTAGVSKRRLVWKRRPPRRKRGR